MKEAHEKKDRCESAGGLLKENAWKDEPLSFRGSSELTGPRHCSSLSVSLGAADGNRRKAVNAAKHSSTALSPLPHWRNLSLFYFPRIPEDVRALLHL